MGLGYWIFAWLWMGAAFLTAFLAIIIGAVSLDKQTTESGENQS